MKGIHRPGVESPSWWVTDRDGQDFLFIIQENNNKDLA